MNKLLVQVESAVREAGRVSFSKQLMGDFVIDFKQDDPANIVSSVDYKVQSFLKQALGDLEPAASWLTEEDDFRSEIQLEDLSNKGGSMFWVVDPIDGTTNFAHGIPHYAISVSLVCDGKPYIAAVYNPATDEMFTAEFNCGAHLNGSRIEVSSKSSLSQCVVAFGLPYDREKSRRLLDRVQRVAPYVRDMRRMGSASLDMAYVAAGRFDAYFEYDLRPWDISAGKLLVSEAGGRVSDWKSRDLEWNQKSNVVASNTIVHKEILQLAARKADF